MKIKELLDITEHRPWAIPKKNWKYYQEWKNVIFLHWQVDLNELKKFIPIELEIDLFKGKPWVSLVAFTMEKIRPRFLPSFPPISDFHEINIRTYVKKENKAGVYFLSIEAGTQISCKIAKFLSDLPYRYSSINRKKSIFISKNKSFDDYLQLAFKVGKEIENKSEIDKWLTERYTLFQDSNSSINEFEIHHIEWPLYEIDFNEIQIEYQRYSNLLNTFPNRKSYSSGVQVIAWDKKTNQKDKH